jgi:transglutaminase-like putative cysteine protease
VAFTTPGGHDGWRLDARRLNWLTVCTTLVLAPHVVRLPPWVSGLFVLLCLWRLWRVHHGLLQPPSRVLVLLIAIGTLPGVWISYGTLTGRQAGVALLTILAATKLLETRNQRDAYVLCYLGFFLIVTSFLYSQSPIMAAYMVVVVVVLTSTLAVLTRERPGASTLGELRQAGLLVLQAVPLTLLLFAIFPRIPGPLWGLPADAGTGVTGLSDDLTMGDISELSQSDAVAFRARFDGPPPPPEKRYWRGPVLEFTDGRRWQQATDRLRDRMPAARHAGAALDYEVFLEPARDRILLALDLPATLPRDSRVTEAFSLRRTRPRSGRLRYRMRSYLDYRLGGSQLQRARALGLPGGAHPRARALALRLRRGATAPRDLVDRALAHFRNQPFRYTLTPQRLDGDPIDQFLFQTREGFCEHYAAAFTVLMRFAGIPARVVTGYQGGELNPVSGYMVVRQRDAHAWAEVWLGEPGWVRVDPTAAVAPTRIDAGVDAALPRTADGTDLQKALDDLGLGASTGAGSLLRSLRDGWDALQTGWNTWVVGYGDERQRNLLSRLGLDASLANLSLLTVAMVVVVMGVLAAWLLRRARVADPVQRQFLRYCDKLARHGLRRQAHEGPVAFAERVCALRPELTDAVRDITRHYVALRYADATPNAQDVAALRRRVRSLRIA